MPDLFSSPSVNIPTQNLTNELNQIYQGVANTAGPYANLAASLEPYYGQIGLGNLQQQLFGYNTGGAPGSIGTPATPPGGFLGSPQPAPGIVGPLPNSSIPGNPYGPPGVGMGGDGQPGSVVGPQPGVPAAPPTGGTLYSPPQGTLIGLGPDHPFFDPYAGQPTPANALGYHPGVLDLNTTALGTYGGAATDALLASNPYLSDALNLQNIAAFNAATPTDLQLGLNDRANSQSPLLSLLNSQAQSGLESNGALSPQEQRDLTQGALSSLGQGGLTHGNTGIAVDLLSRDSAVRQRQQAAQALGLSVQQANQAQNQFGLGVQQGNLAQQGLAGQLAGATANTASTAVTNPILQLLGLGNLNTNANPSTAIGDQSSLFNPFQQIGSDVFNFNANANANSAIANANSQAVTNAGILGLIGQFAGSYFGGGYGG